VEDIGEYKEHLEKHVQRMYKKYYKCQYCVRNQLTKERKKERSLQTDTKKDSCMNVNGIGFMSPKCNLPKKKLNKFTEKLPNT